jgi:hypothetical protein
VNCSCSLDAVASLTAFSYGFEHTFFDRFVFGYTKQLATSKTVSSSSSFLMTIITIHTFILATFALIKTSVEYTNHIYIYMMGLKIAVIVLLVTMELGTIHCCADTLLVAGADYKYDRVMKFKWFDTKGKDIAITIPLFERENSHTFWSHCVIDHSSSRRVTFHHENWNDTVTIEYRRTSYPTTDCSGSDSGTGSSSSSVFPISMRYCSNIGHCVGADMTLL